MTLDQIMAAYDEQAMDVTALIETLQAEHGRRAGRFAVADLEDVNWAQGTIRYASPKAALTHATLSAGQLSVIDLTTQSVYDCATVREWMEYRHEPIVTTSHEHQLDQAVGAMMTAIREGHNLAVTAYARNAAHHAAAILG